MIYHIGRLVLSSLRVGVFAAADIWWCSFCRLIISLQFVALVLKPEADPVLTILY